MRNKIRFILIKLANKIGDDSHYDFGGEVVSMATFGNKLLVATRNSVFVLDKARDGGWIKVKVGDKTTNKEVL